MSHAILSPSAAHRWLSCTPSARFELQFPDRSSEAAAEGTLAHKLAELQLTLQLFGDHLISDEMEVAKMEATRNAIEADPLYQVVMEEHIEEYVTFVTERYNSAKAPLIFLEHKLDLSSYVPEGFGTGDVVLIDHGTLELIDLKYGKGVLVNAENNKQLMLYGLGALEDLGFLYDVSTVRLTIYQPRISNYSSWEISADELKQWAEAELRPKAKLAFDGKGKYVPGDHCRFCKAAAVCKANATRHLELAAYDFTDANKLDPIEISDILRRADDFTTWIKAVEDYALDQAVNHGIKWPNYKLVEGRSVRKYVDEEQVAEKLLQSDYSTADVYTSKVRGITDLEKTIGKKRFQELLGDLIIKPQGKPTLAPNEDKRPEWNSHEAAVTDFTN